MTGWTDDEREATLRLLVTQPDGDALAVVLGLVEAPVVPKQDAPKPFHSNRKAWCDIHNIAREPLPWDDRGTRCMMCFRDKSRRRYYKEIGKPVPVKVRVYKRKATDV